MAAGQAITSGVQRPATVGRGSKSVRGTGASWQCRSSHDFSRCYEMQHEAGAGYMFVLRGGVFVPPTSESELAHLLRFVVHPNKRVLEMITAPQWRNWQSAPLRHRWSRALQQFREHLKSICVPSSACWRCWSSSARRGL